MALASVFETPVYPLRLLRPLNVYKDRDERRDFGMNDTLLPSRVVKLTLLPRDFDVDRLVDVFRLLVDLFFLFLEGLFPTNPAPPLTPTFSATCSATYAAAPRAAIPAAVLTGLVLT